MVEQKILKFCIERGFLLDKELLDAFSEIEDQEIIKTLMIVLQKIKTNLILMLIVFLFKKK